MRIALVHSFYSSATPSGENNIVMAQLAALEKRGHEVLLVARYTDDESHNPLYKIRSAVNVATGGGASPIGTLTDFAPDIVHVHNLFPNFSRSWLSSWQGPLIATLHNYRPVCSAGTLFRQGHHCTECIDSGSHRAVINRCYRKSSLATIPLAIQTRSGIDGDPVLRRADRLIVLADRAYHLYRSLGVDQEKLTLLPNFVDGAPFSPHVTPGSHWTYIGRLAPEKGIHTLINSWPADQELHIYGDGPLLDQVRQRAATLPHVRSFGSIPRSEVPKVLSEARGLVFPSEWPEGAPLVYLEALAAGRPVVARRGNSVADDVAAHGTGMVYSTDTQLKESLVAATGNWSYHHSRARAHFESTFSELAWTMAVEQVYVDVLKRLGHQ